MIPRPRRNKPRPISKAWKFSCDFFQGLEKPAIPVSNAWTRQKSERAPWRARYKRRKVEAVSLVAPPQGGFVSAAAFGEA
jgi:hypothetical protein